MTATTTSIRPLDELAGTIRDTLEDAGDWAAAAQRVGDALGRRLPPASILSDAQRAGSPAGAVGHTLHVEPDGSFSVIALVWRPGQVTRVHDHVTWCVFAVLEGEPVEELFALDDAAAALIPIGREACPAGTVSGGAPPGDIHRVGNPGARTAISLHVYGTDVSRIGSSVRRVYDLPVRSQ
jgi:predicted metal-dependent enzyme (double-stranded beta helix superfamily)